MSETYLLVNIDGEQRRMYVDDQQLKKVYEKVFNEYQSEESATPESPNHYSRLKALTGVETWDILDFVAVDDPDMWNLGKYWFRMGHKEGQSTLTEKKKMLKYLERSIAKEESTV